MAKRKDENEMAKSLIDDIIAETESEDWNKPKSEKPQKKSAAQSKDPKHQPSRSSNKSG